ncbi:MAG: ABC transporter permease [Dehalococcoidia bacterium]
MRAYIIRRLLAVPLMLLGASLVLFLLLYIRPGNAAFATVGGIQEATDVKAFEERLGLDRPWYIQYLDWLGNAVQGDFGRSLVPPHEPVSDQIMDRIGNTVELGLLTVGLAAVFGIAVGVLSAVRRNQWPDYVLRILTVAGISIPGFWAATLLVTLPARWWDWTPLSGEYVTFTQDPLTNLTIVIWPALILAYGSAAYIARILRSSMLEVFYADFVRTARAKGVRERAVVVRHVFRNSLLTLLTVVGLQLGAVLGGAVIAEQIFAIPGIGLLTFQAVLQEDYVVVLGTIMVFALLFIVINLIVDVLYTVVDPRIRY